jgi:ABC-type transporter Mla subunit MlaD
VNSNNRSHYVIALAVIACSLLLLAALTFALTDYSWKQGGRKLAIEFHDATGIKLHSPVKFAGKNAGSVTEIRYLSPEERLKARDQQNSVRVIIQLDNDVPPLSADLVVRLDAETLLGEKFVALVPGKPDAPALPDGAVVQGEEVTSIGAVTRSALTAIANANEILTKLKADYPALVPPLAELLRNGNAVLVQGSNLVNSADSTILNANGAVTQVRADYAEWIPKLNTLFAQANGIATNADFAIQKVSTLLERADGILKSNEGNLGKIIDELHIVSQNLKVITTYTKALSAALAAKPSRLIWGGKSEIIPEKDILENPEPIPAEKVRK